MSSVRLVPGLCLPSGHIPGPAHASIFGHTQFSQFPQTAPSPQSRLDIDRDNTTHKSYYWHNLSIRLSIFRKGQHSFIVIQTQRDTRYGWRAVRVCEKLIEDNISANRETGWPSPRTDDTARTYFLIAPVTVSPTLMMTMPHYPRSHPQYPRQPPRWQWAASPRCTTWSSSSSPPSPCPSSASTPWSSSTGPRLVSSEIYHTSPSLISNFPACRKQCAHHLLWCSRL